MLLHCRIVDNQCANLNPNRSFTLQEITFHTFEELFGFVCAEPSFPVHEVILVNKILATL